MPVPGLFLFRRATVPDAVDQSLATSAARRLDAAPITMGKAILNASSVTGKTLMGGSPRNVEKQRPTRVSSIRGVSFFDTTCIARYALYCPRLVFTRRAR